MASEVEIRRRLLAVVDGNLNLWDFADWFDSYSWSMHYDSVPAAIHLAAQIQHRFADYDIHGDEAVLRNRLASLLDRIIVSVPIDVSSAIAAAALPRFISSERWIRPVFRPVAA